MIIDIKRHPVDAEMYELWQVVNGTAKYLMAVVHSDLLDIDVCPGNLGKTQIRVEMRLRGLERPLKGVM